MYNYKIRISGYLIGTAGRTIRGFENNTGAKIDILTPNSYNHETPVLLSGPHESVRNVLKQITDLYHKNNLSSILFQHLWKDHGDYNENGDRKIIGHEEIIINSIFIPPIQATLPSIETDLKVHVEIGKESEDRPGIVALGFVGQAANVANAIGQVSHIRISLFCFVHNLPATLQKFLKLFSERMPKNLLQNFPKFHEFLIVFCFKGIN